MEDQISPVIKIKDETMNFSEAIKWLNLGARMTKLEWGNKKIYIVLRNGFLMLHKEDGKDYQLLVSEGDMSGEDWVKLEEVN